MAFGNIIVNSVMNNTLFSGVRKNGNFVHSCICCLPGLHIQKLSQEKFSCCVKTTFSIKTYPKAAVDFKNYNFLC